jgi:hypothetical protein
MPQIRKLESAHRAMASCHDGLSKATAADYHADLRDSHKAAAGACSVVCDILQEAIDEISAVPDVAEESETNASAMGSDTFEAATGIGALRKAQFDELFK